MEIKSGSVSRKLCLILLTHLLGDSKLDNNKNGVEGDLIGDENLAYSSGIVLNLLIISKQSGYSFMSLQGYNCFKYPKSVIGQFHRLPTAKQIYANRSKIGS